MYLTSDCPDYRFTYEREAPHAAALMEAAVAMPTIRRKRLPQVRASRCPLAARPWRQASP